MPALHELQRRFGVALRDGDTAAIEPWIRAAGIEPARRIAIYRNNWRENFHTTLASAYPVLRCLVGDDYFRQMAHEFQELYPSHSGNLQHLGAPLPTFLERRFFGTQFAYFTDVARLEWAYQEILVAAEHAPLAVERLATVAESGWSDLGFTLHPAVRLVRSDYPVLSIWSAHQPGADGAEPAAIDKAPIELDAGGENICLRRTDLEVEMRRLRRAEFAFLECLARGASLAVAAEEAIAFDAGFDLAQALKRYVALAVLVDFTTPATPYKS
jgi:hypothetical protein